MAPELELD
jgi:hypothetical protein